MAKSFVLHDETVNTYGFRMLTSGCDLSELRKNPVLLLNHEDWSIPIGRWENIRVEGGKILADAVFDQLDPKAAEIERKVESDFLRMASIGAWPPEEVSDAYDLRMPKQKLPTVTKWTAREASIVTIGANHNALAFYDRATGKLIDLNNPQSLVRLMDSTHQNNQNKMSILTGVLKLHDGASEAEIATAVQGIIANNDRLTKENQTLTAAIDKQNQAKKQAEKLEAVQLVDKAIQDGRLDAKGKETYLELFDADFEKTKQALASIPQRARVAPHLKTGETSVEMADWASKSWDELDKAGKLLELKDAYPELYVEKFEKRYGVKPNM